MGSVKTRFMCNKFKPFEVTIEFKVPTSVYACSADVQHKVKKSDKFCSTCGATVRKRSDEYNAPIKETVSTVNEFIAILKDQYSNPVVDKHKDGTIVFTDTQLKELSNAHSYYASMQATGTNGMTMVTCSTDINVPYNKKPKSKSSMFYVTEAEYIAAIKKGIVEATNKKKKEEAVVVGYMKKFFEDVKTETIFSVW